jgi:hypothetical protein
MGPPTSCFSVFLEMERKSKKERTTGGGKGEKR